MRAREAPARIGAIVNARAHANARHPDRAERIARALGPGVRITRSLDDLELACRRWAEDLPDVIAICGGDGTVHRTITALRHAIGRRALPAIAILRGGAMNIIATSLGIRGDPVKQVHALATTPASALSIVRCGVLDIEDRYGFLFGTGVVHHFLDAYYATARPSAGTAARLLVRAMASSAIGGRLANQLCRPVHARVTADGLDWPCERFLAICAATVEQIGFGFRPFRRCRDRPDGFAALGITTTCVGLLRELPRIWTGEPIRHGKAIDEAVRELVIDPREPDGVPYMIDGELYESAGPLAIRRGPVLRFVR